MTWWHSIPLINMHTQVDFLNRADLSEILPYDETNDEKQVFISSASRLPEDMKKQNGNDLIIHSNLSLTCNLPSHFCIVILFEQVTQRASYRCLGVLQTPPFYSPVARITRPWCGTSCTFNQFSISPQVPSTTSLSLFIPSLFLISTVYPLCPPVNLCPALSLPPYPSSFTFLSPLPPHFQHPTLYICLLRDSYTNILLTILSLR